jgi:hypothetical protein
MTDATGTRAARSRLVRLKDPLRLDDLADAPLRQTGGVRDLLERGPLVTSTHDRGTQLFAGLRDDVRRTGYMGQGHFS